MTWSFRKRYGWFQLTNYIIEENIVGRRFWDGETCYEGITDKYKIDSCKSRLSPKKKLEEANTMSDMLMLNCDVRGSTHFICEKKCHWLSSAFAQAKTSCKIKEVHWLLPFNIFISLHDIKSGNYLVSNKHQSKKKIIIDIRILITMELVCSWNLSSVVR